MGPDPNRRKTAIANETQLKFGYPDTLIAEYDHWCVLVRAGQATLGAMVLVCTEDATSFSAISPAAFGELGSVIGDIETASKAFREWDKINYLMLMMVDPNVHFHVLPRYGEPQAFGELVFEDGGWPGQPDLAGGVKLSPEQIGQLVAALKAVWPEAR